ncbi:MAG: SLC13 family permease [Candidatus Hydrogenedentota bacterium]
MTWEIWFVAGVIVLIIAALIRNWGPPDMVLLGGSLVCGLVGIISPEQVFSGFVNQGTLTIAALFVVAGAMSETGALESVQRWIFGRAKTEKEGLRRLALSVSTMSALFNNTPIVAMLMPVVNEWCRKNGISPSRILMPLSFLAILGGTCTLIGTSTHLAVNGLILSTLASTPELNDSLRPLQLFELAWVGVPFVFVGILYILFIGRHWLPERKDLMQSIESSPREYFAEMQIQADCALIGQDIEAAGLRHLPGLFLMEIVRGDTVITPVRPEQVLEQDDVLTFAGVVSTMVDLERKFQGLVPVADENYEDRSSERRGKYLCEAVISSRSPLIAKSIRDADFRAMYNAAIIAVHRGGGRIQGRIGDIVLRAGDTLLLQAGHEFGRLHHNNPDFYLVSDIEGSQALRHEKVWVSSALMVLLIILMTIPSVPVVYAAFVVAGLMIFTGCLSSTEARESIDWPTLITIGSAFGLGYALEESQAAQLLGDTLVGIAGASSSYMLLGLVYLVTGIFAAVVSSKAAAVLMYPVALAVAFQVGLSPQPFVLAIMYSAAASFATPLGYPTNLIVYGPGGYKFTDFMRVGVPLNLVLMVIAVYLIPKVWGF